MWTTSHLGCATAATFVAAMLVGMRARADECGSVSMPPDPPGVKTHTRIDKVGGRYRATLDIETSRSRGERVLEADSCEALARSTAVVVAMAVAPAREDAREDTNEAATPTPSVPPPAEGKTERDAAPRKERDSSTEVRPQGGRQPEGSSTEILVRAEAAADGAMLPALAAGGGIALGVRATERLRFEAHFAAFLPQEALTFADRGAKFSLVSGGARACWAITRALEVAPCAGIGVSAIGASGLGAKTVNDGTAFVVAPEALVAFRVPVAGPIYLSAAAGIVVPLSRESFVITGRGTVHEIPAVAARGFVGPEVRF